MITARVLRSATKIRKVGSCGKFSCGAQRKAKIFSLTKTVINNTIDTEWDCSRVISHPLVMLALHWVVRGLISFCGALAHGSSDLRYRLPVMNMRDFEIVPSVVWISTQGRGLLLLFTHSFATLWARVQSIHRLTPLRLKSVSRFMNRATFRPK